MHKGGGRAMNNCINLDNSSGKSKDCRQFLAVNQACAYRNLTGSPTEEPLWTSSQPNAGSYLLFFYPWCWGVVVESIFTVMPKMNNTWLLSSMYFLHKNRYKRNNKIIRNIPEQVFCIDIVLLRLLMVLYTHIKHL